MDLSDIIYFTLRLSQTFCISKFNLFRAPIYFKIFFQAIVYELRLKWRICFLLEQILLTKNTWNLLLNWIEIYPEGVQVSNLPCNMVPIFFYTVPENIGSELLKQATVYIILINFMQKKIVPGFMAEYIFFWARS